VTVTRRRAQAAQIVIVNHHLYFADLALQQRLGDIGVSLVPPHDLAIFDEAHDLDEVAAQHFGFQMSDRRIHDLAHDVQRAAENDPSLAAQVGPLCEELFRRTDRLFAALASDGRSRIADVANDPLLVVNHGDLDQALERLEAVLDNAGLEDGKALARRACLVAAELTFILELEARRSVVAEIDLHTSGPYVRYAERIGRARHLVARPLIVSELLRSYLEDLPAVFVSATLAVGGDFSHFRQRLGLLRAKEIAVGSPFDYQENACLYLPDDLPLPDDPEYGTLAARRAAALVAASGGGAFVLCTSRRVLPLMRAAIEKDAAVEVLMQGDAPRSRIIEQFRSDGHAVLVATMSFWQGVDVPGAALRLVVIDRLPFASPADPLTAARLESMRQAGDDPFMGYQVPQAALLLRQGFGRLIRRQTDRGMVAILDRRITTRRYGRIFLASLPDCPRVSRLVEAEAFLATVRTA
jgi:ATP-dependent DNA helicase DinG